MKKLLAVILAIASVFSLATFSASAENTAENTVVITKGDTDYIFDADISDDLMNRYIYVIETELDCDDTATYGLMCTLFGHKLESSVVSTLTHKARSTDPRCLKRTYSVEACTRCDYTSQTLLGSTYISCC